MINLHRFVMSNPTSYIDLMGSFPMMANGMARHPCQDRTEDYCRSALDQNCQNRAQNCFCRVSTGICRSFIVNMKKGNPGAAARMDCINRCMYRNWKERRRKFPNADNVCKAHGIGSMECCQANVQAEQDGLTACFEVVCPGLGFAGPEQPLPSLVFLDPNSDERKRVAWATEWCCTKGFGAKVWDDPTKIWGWE
jgi:hypothetical protein